MKKLAVLFLVICCALIVSASAKGPAETEVFDTSYLEQWCGQPNGRIRMVGAWFTEDGLIEDETGNLWEEDFETMSSQDSFLLLWIDNNGTPDVVHDDIIVKTWVEIC
jgi:hypothetical protein